MQQSEHALTAASGYHRQHRVHEEAALGAIANGPEAADGWTIAIIHLRIIVHHQHHSWLLLHLLTCLLPDGTTDRLMGHPIGSHQTVGRLESGPVSAHLSGQAALWIRGHLGRHPHQAPGSSWIS